MPVDCIIVTKKKYLPVLVLHWIDSFLYENFVFDKIVVFIVEKKMIVENLTAPNLFPFFF